MLSKLLLSLPEGVFFQRVESHLLPLVAEKDIELRNSQFFNAAIADLVQPSRRNT